ncbi:diguanylate cyclase domain-containing protein [Bacillus massilinigeriensis]|uniref:diguanylate cyclase domain-containing protein n=1 Tax=Bacillus massilionigeriensis TaxID=1805475 RepID=UPI0009FE2F18|nr:diguanylate cyclase [Bacillus massilionigeriensis]
MDDLTLIHKQNRRVILLLWLFLSIDFILNLFLFNFSFAKVMILTSLLPLLTITIFVRKRKFIKSTMYIITFLLMLDLLLINIFHSNYINLFFVILPIFISLSYREWINVLISIAGSGSIFVTIIRLHGREFFTQWQPFDSLYFLLFFMMFGSIIIYESKNSEATRFQLKNELSEVKKLQGKLFESEERYRAMVKQSTEGIFAFHPETKKIVETNELFCKMLGYEEDELINFSIKKVIVADDKSVEANIESVVKKNRDFLGERRYLCKSGEEIIVEVSATLISINNDQLILSSIRDITEHKRTEEMIKKQEKLFNAVYEGMSRLLTAENPVDAIKEALGIIGKSIPVDHVYVFENKRASNQEETMNLCFEWVNNNAIPYIDKSIMQDLPYSLFKESNWFDWLAEGNSINGPLQMFSEKEQKLLKMVKIKSVLVVPIFIREEFWGFIGFSDSIQEKTWNTNEEMILMAAAANIGGAIKGHLDSIKLQESEKKYRLIADNITDVVGLIDRDFNILYVSPSFGSIMKELPDVNDEGYPIKYVHPEDCESVNQAFQNMLKNKKTLQTEFRWKGENGWINLEFRATPVIESDGEIRNIVTTCRNITERVTMEERVKQTTARLETLISHLPYGILAEDKDNKLLLINEQFTDMFGDPHLVDLGEGWDKEHRNTKMVFFEQALYDKRTREIIKNREMVLEEEWALLDGRVISRDAIPIFTNNKFDGFLWQFKDITTQKKIEQDLKEASLIDGLTNISNRRYFDETIEREWNRCSRSSKPLTLIMLDIDRFKKFNDTYGHQRGDECLIKVAQTIKETIKRPSDVVCRYGGEEFAIILPETTEEGGEFVAERIRAAIESLEIPHVASKVSPYVTCSLGVATVIPSTLTTPDEIIRMADKALYESKNHGRNRYSVYDNKESLQL